MQQEGERFGSLTWTGEGHSSQNTQTLMAEVEGIERSGTGSFQLAVAQPSVEEQPGGGGDDGEVQQQLGHERVDLIGGVVGD